MPRLTITQGPLAGQQFSFTDDVVIGRGAYCDVRLDDSTVSRRHAEIKRAVDGSWSLHDLDSANGTLYDGNVIKSAARLVDDRPILFGEVLARFSASESMPRPDDGNPSLPHVLERYFLLCRLATLQSRREDPLELIALALDAIMETFELCRNVDLFTVRAGAAAPVALMRRSRDASAPVPLEFAKVALRSGEEFAGDAQALIARGVINPPASALAAAVTFAGETLGCLVAESAHEGTWSEHDHVLGKSIAGTFAVLLDGIRSSRPDRRVAERDLLLARRVQQHFLPQAALRIPGYRVAEAYVPARAVGGDHYEFFRFRDDRIGIIIADVSGKAVSAALVMARFGMAVRLLASQSGGPVELLVTLNILLLDELESGMFVTAQALALSPADGVLEIANAGHPAPLLRSRAGEVTDLVLESGAPLGADARTAFRASTHRLDPGTCLLLYSDGLDEAENVRGEAMGIDPVRAAMRACADARGALDAINQTLATFVGAAAPTDDLTLVVLSRDEGV